MCTAILVAFFLLFVIFFLSHIGIQLSLSFLAKYEPNVFGNSCLLLQWTSYSATECAQTLPFAFREAPWVSENCAKRQRYS